MDDGDEVVETQGKRKDWAGWWDGGRRKGVNEVLDCLSVEGVRGGALGVMLVSDEGWRCVVLTAFVGSIVVLGSDELKCGRSIFLGIF